MNLFFRDSARARHLHVHEDYVTFEAYRFSIGEFMAFTRRIAANRGCRAAIDAYERNPAVINNEQLPLDPSRYTTSALYFYRQAVYEACR